MQLPEHKFYNCVVKLTDNSVSNLDANWIHNNNYDLWQGWHCHAGMDRILIDASGEVYSGECKNDYLGNIDTGWELLSTPTVCKRQQCTGCTDDLLVTKESPNVV